MIQKPPPMHHLKTNMFSHFQYQDNEDPMVFTLSDIKLLPSSEIGPDFTGTKLSAGTAEIDLVYDGAKRQACISAIFVGTAPVLMHIHEAFINENGGVVLDFTPLLTGSMHTEGCMDITEELFGELMNTPVRTIK
jgi:hypothetical protein